MRVLYDDPVGILAGVTPPPVGGVPDGHLFTGAPVMVVQSPAATHESKKRAGSSDGAQTYDTPVT